MRGLESVRSDDLTFDDFGEIIKRLIMTNKSKNRTLKTTQVKQVYNPVMDRLLVSSLWGFLF